MVGIAGAGKDHLALLGKIAQVFVDKERVAELEAAQTPADVQRILGGVAAQGLTQPPRASAQRPRTAPSRRSLPDSGCADSASEQPQQGRGQRGADDHDEERRAQQQQHDRDRRARRPGRRARAAWPLREDLHRDQRGQQRDRDQVGDPLDQRVARAPAAAPRARPASAGSSPTPAASDRRPDHRWASGISVGSGRRQDAGQQRHPGGGQHRARRPGRPAPCRARPRRRPRRPAGCAGRAAAARAAPGTRPPTAASRP